MGTVHREKGEESTRRKFLASTSALSAASLLGLSYPAAAEPPPETKRIRLLHAPAICLAPQYLAEDLLRLEGFSEVEYVEDETGTASKRWRRAERPHHVGRLCRPARARCRQAGRADRRHPRGLLRTVRHGRGFAESET